MSAHPRLLTSILVALGSGLLLFLAFPPVGWWPIAFVAVAPLLIMVRTSGARRGALIGLAFGFGFYGATIYWILLFGEMAWVALVLLCMASTALFGLVAPAVCRRGHPLVQAAGLSALWVVVDWIRTMWPLGGFSWGTVGLSQVGNRPTLHLAAVTGAWGVTFVVIAVNALIAETVAGERRLGRVAGRAAIALALVLAPVLIPSSVPERTVRSASPRCRSTSVERRTTRRPRKMSA